MVAPNISDWIFCGLLESFPLLVEHNRISCGMFEITSNPEPFESIEYALDQSIEAYKLNQRQPRGKIKTFFLGADEKSVIASGRLYAREALSLFGIAHFGFGSMKLTRAGCIFDLINGVAKPFLPSLRERPPGGIIAIMNHMATHPGLIINRILSSPTERYGSLGMALRRSTHWSDLATEANEFWDRFLLYWMACESLTRLSENETLTSKFCAALGLPSRRYLQQLPAHERNLLLVIPDFRIWRRNLITLFDKARNIRNEIVHKGFRADEVTRDLSEIEELRLRRLMPMLKVWLQNLTLNGLALGITSVDEMWKRYSDCILFQLQEPLAHTTQGTVIFAISQPESPLDD